MRTLLAKELRDLMRDKKVLGATLLLPALLFPLVLELSGGWFRSAKADLETRPVRVGLVGRDHALARLVALTEQMSWAQGGGREKLRKGELDAVVLVGKAPGRDRRFSLLYDSTRAASRIAARRLESNLDLVIHEERGRTLGRANVDAERLPARLVELVDFAPKGQRGMSTLPRYLPMLLVLILLSAAAFAALDLFPGERERGTIETLLVQPLQTSEILVAKFGAILVVGVAAVLANLTGIFISACIRSGQLSPPDFPITRALSLFLLSVPLCFFLAALLVRVVSKARTVKEGQHYLLPLTLACLLPPFLAGSPHVPFDAITACIPLAGPSLAFRELASGQLSGVALTLMLVSTYTYGCLILRSAWKALGDGEGMLEGRQDLDGDREKRRAILVVLVSILAIYGLSPFFTSQFVLVRFGLPLVCFVGAPAFLFARLVGSTRREMLAGPAPNSSALVLALATGVGLACVATSVPVILDGLLPAPRSFTDAATRSLGKVPPALGEALVVLALLPAACEELLYRRFLLDRLRPCGSAGKAIVVSSALFALHHLSIFRFVPAFVAGLFLGSLVLRTRCFWTAPIAHALSNGLVLLAALPSSPIAGSALADLLQSEDLAAPRLLIGVGLILLPRTLLPDPNATGHAFAALAARARG